MISLEILYADNASARRARDELLHTALGASAKDLALVSSVRQYDTLAPIRHTHAILGAVLGALFIALQAGLVLLVLWAIPAVTITGATAGLVLGVAAVYGLVIGAIAGSHAWSRGARLVRDGIERGGSLVRASFRDMSVADDARRVLTSQPGAAAALAF